MRLDDPQFILTYEKMAKAYGARPNFHETKWAETKMPESMSQDYLIIRTMDFESPRGLFLYGSPGVGKTHALKLKFNEVYNQLVADYMERIIWKHFPYWIHASSYLEAQRNFNEPSVAEKIKWNAINAKWLFIDDLGATTKTDWAIDQVYQLVDERLQSGRQTFITSNLSPSELGSFYNERISSRIAELCLPVYLDGVDRRVEIMKEDYVARARKIKLTANNGQQA